MTAPTTSVEPDTLLRAAELAARVGVRTSNVQEWIRRGELKAVSQVASGRGAGHTVGLYSLEHGKQLARLLFERKRKQKLGAGPH